MAVPLNQSASSSSHTFVVQMPSHVATALVHPYFDLEVSHLGICRADDLGVPDDGCYVVQHFDYCCGHFHVLSGPASPPSPPAPPHGPPSPPPPLPPFYSSPIRLSVGNLSNTAEEFANGAVALYSSDLELLSDGAGSAALQSVLIVFLSVPLLKVCQRPPQAVDRQAGARGPAGDLSLVGCALAALPYGAHRPRVVQYAARLASTYCSSMRGSTRASTRRTWSWQSTR